MQIGEWEIKSCLAGRFGLDGGAMFGVVPRTMWAKRLVPDEYNRIPMVMRLLVAKGHGKTILVDVGAGGGHSEKNSDIYAFEDTEQLAAKLISIGVQPEEITDVLLTHLHFDHGAGIVEPDKDGWKLLFPQAAHHVQTSQWEPNARDRASYYQDRLEVMKIGNVLNLHEGAWSLADGFDLEVFDGHTPGQQLPLISGGGESLFFCGDLIPTQHHIPTPYIMSYDLDPVLAMEEKLPILERATGDNWVLFFEHDAHLAGCRLIRDGKRFSVGEELTL